MGFGAILAYPMAWAPDRPDVKIKRLH